MPRFSNLNPDVTVRASSFRMIGRAAPPRPLITVWNGVAAGVMTFVIVTRLEIFADMSTAVAVTDFPVLRAYRVTAAPTGGTALTKVLPDTTETSNASVTATADASADGTNTASALTQTTVTAGAMARSCPLPRLLATTSGWTDRTPLEFVDEYFTILSPQQGICVRAEALDAAGQSYVANVVWQEFALGT